MATSAIGSALGATPTPKSSSDTATAKLASDFDNFLKLLTTQLQYQDPLAPMDANQFTTQLVQFTQVEQSVKMNRQIESLVKVERASQALSSVAFIGTDVEVKSAKLPFNGTDPVTWHYSLDQAAQSVSVQVQNAQGRTVRVIVGETPVGRHDLVWDGKDAAGKLMPPGTYTLVVNALGDRKSPIESSITGNGRVSAVSTNSDDIRLSFGDVEFSLDDVVTIRKSAAN